jgi:hypothetical protein
MSDMLLRLPVVYFHGDKNKSTVTYDLATTWQQITLKFKL